MARRIPEEELAAIEAIVSRNSGGVTAGVIEQELAAAIPRRTFQYRLKSLVSAGLVVRDGSEGSLRVRRTPRGDALLALYE